jgi:hypothetical protein
MTICRTRVLSDLATGHDGAPIPRSTLSYYRERFRNRVFDFIVTKFADQEAQGLNQSKLGKRIDRDPKIIHRWLSEPSNLTLDSVSDLLIGIAAEELDLSSTPLLHRPAVNYSHTDQLTAAIKPQPKTEAASAKATLFTADQSVSNATAMALGQIEQRTETKSALCE